MPMKREWSQPFFLGEEMHPYASSRRSRGRRPGVNPLKLQRVLKLALLSKL